MTAQQARKMTDIANSQSGELARIYKKIDKASSKGDNFIDFKNIIPKNITILKEEGFDVEGEFRDNYTILW